MSQTALTTLIRAMQAGNKEASYKAIRDFVRFTVNSMPSLPQTGGGDELFNFNTLIGGADPEEVEQTVVIPAPEATKCVELIQKCIQGEEGCKDEFTEVSKTLDSCGKINFTSGSLKDIKTLLANLKIDVSVADPLEQWKTNLATTFAFDNASVEKILKNESLMTILAFFIAKLKETPLPTPVTIKTEKKIISTIDDLPLRKECNKLKQAGGGNMVNNKKIKFSTFPRYVEEIRNLLEMNGGNSINSLADETIKLYKQMVAKLNKVGKQVQNQEEIIEFLKGLKATEEELNKIFKYLVAYKRLEESIPEEAASDLPDFKTELAKLTEDDEKQLKQKYNELKEQYKKDVNNILDIYQSIYEAFAPGPLTPIERMEKLEKVYNL